MAPSTSSAATGVSVSISVSMSCHGEGSHVGSDAIGSDGRWFALGSGDGFGLGSGSGCALFGVGVGFWTGPSVGCHVRLGGWIGEGVVGMDG